MESANIGILGYGQIGKGIYSLIKKVQAGPNNVVWSSEYVTCKIFADSVPRNFPNDEHVIIDFSASTEVEIANALKENQITCVMNALPFVLNEKVAKAALLAGCHYIDFTEDDTMADKVQDLYKDSSLHCVVKCGLAPGFINYVGLDLTKKVHAPESLMISVGALPRSVSYNEDDPLLAYNMSWSIDGLVNEYIRPCRVRENGVEKLKDPLSDIKTVVIDGMKYEAASTSGGIGSLVKDLPHVPNVQYMTLRYPGHYGAVKDLVFIGSGLEEQNFNTLKNVFQRYIPFTDEDVIVVFASASGKDENGNLIVRNVSGKFYGRDELTGIQCTTAGSGLAIFELMRKKKLRPGITNHSDINFVDFKNTKMFEFSYRQTPQF